MRAYQSKEILGMGKITIQDLETAAMWLEINDGDNGESESCLRVADWLNAEAAKRIKESAIRAAAKSAGIAFKDAKRVLRDR